MKIMVLAGGLSTERDVSLTTGTMVTQALRSGGHQAALVDMFLGVEQPITDMVEFFAGGGSAAVSGVAAQAPDLAAVRLQRADQSSSRIGPQVLDIARASDVVFLALHGADGEDGRIQALFDLLGVKYTGSGALGSGMAMDKALAKIVLASAGVRVPFGVLLAAGDPLPDNIPYPCVVKPCCGGSSVATTLVEDASDMRAALDTVFVLGDKALVEEYVKGREFSVAVLDDRALPVIELVYNGALFDYYVKYQANACREICPAPIDDDLAKRMQQLALIAHRVLRLDVYSRVDFIVTEQREIYALEVNTLPGMTAASIVPREAAAAGIEYNALCQQVIDLSLRRFEA